MRQTALKPRVQSGPAHLYLYMVIDVYSRKIMAWTVHSEECMHHSATLIDTMCHEHGLDPRGIILHSDNGGPMKGSTMLATLQRLGIVASFSRPRVSDDNPFSEALFRTLKYCPQFPSDPFETIDDAGAPGGASVRRQRLSLHEPPSTLRLAQIPG